MKRFEIRHSVTKSAVELHILLEENSPEADAVRATFHRTVLDNWRKGRRLPSVSSAARLETIAGKRQNGTPRIPATGWAEAAETDRSMNG